MFTRIAWGLSAAGALLLAVAGTVAYRHHQSMDGMVIVPAAVVDRMDVRTNGINRSRPLVSFTTLSGDAIQFVAMNVLKNDDGLHVVYRVSNPQDARVHLGLGEYLVPFVLAIIGLASSLIGGALFRILAAEAGPAVRRSFP